MMISNVVLGGALAYLFAAPSLAYTPDRTHYNASSYCETHKGSASSFAGVVPLGEIPGLFPDPSGPENPDDFVQIRNTGMLYPLAIDGKNFGSLSNVFTSDVVANLSQGPVITGLPALEGALAGSVSKVDSHHNLGTQYISIADNGCTAESITYFHASLIGKGPTYGQVCSSQPRIEGKY